MGLPFVCSASRSDSDWVDDEWRASHLSGEYDGWQGVVNKPCNIFVPIFCCYFENETKILPAVYVMPVHVLTLSFLLISFYAYAACLFFIYSEVRTP